MNIDVQIVQPDGTKRWERVRMLVDSGADLDLMSKKTVRILGVKMMPLDERMPKVHLQDGHQLEIESYVDIVWFGERSRRRVETRFFVPATERCEFEAILSCKSSQEQGLLAIYVAATKTIQPKMTEGELDCLIMTCSIADVNISQTNSERNRLVRASKKMR